MRLSERPSERLPARLSERLPERLSERPPERFSERELDVAPPKWLGFADEPNFPDEDFPDEEPPEGLRDDVPPAEREVVGRCGRGIVAVLS